MTTRYKQGTSDPREGIEVSDWPIQNKAPEFILPEVQESSVAEHTSLVEEQPIRWPAQIWDLNDARYELNAALMIIIEEYRSEENIVARFPEVGAFGEGATEMEAILNLKRDIVSLFDELSEEEPEKLGGLPQSWLRILNKVITRI
jgi:hypothetical protein